MGDEDDAALVFAQRVLEPRDGFRVEMVGRLVEQQDVRRVEQQARQRDAALLAARQRRDVGVAVGTAQRVHRLVDLAVEIPKALRLDLVLQPAHLFRRLVGVVGGDLVVAVDQRLLRRDAFHDVAAHVLRRVQLRLLRQISHAHAVGGPGLAGEFLVHAGHDAHQRGLARAVDADDADLGAGIERQPDVLEHLLAAGIGLRKTLHHIDVLRTGHAAEIPCWGGAHTYAAARASPQKRTVLCGFVSGRLGVARAKQKRSANGLFYRIERRIAGNGSAALADLRLPGPGHRPASPRSIEGRGAFFRSRFRLTAAKTISGTLMPQAGSSA